MADLEQQPIESEDIEKVDVEEESTNLVTFSLGRYFGKGGLWKEGIT